MRITAAEQQKQHLVCVVTDDGEAMIDKTIWLHSGLSVGEELSSEDWLALQERSLSYRAREKALYYLSLRDYGSEELTRKLCQAGIDRVTAAETVARLTDSGLIDDARYARLLARDLSTRKLYPKRRVAAALREKGFTSDVVAEVLSELPEEEEQQALELLRKKGYNKKSERKQREKALAMLARYGFSYVAAQRALALCEDDCEEDNA